MASSFRKYDGRDIREAPYLWMELEFITVFIPLIGPDAAWIYTVMCYLIPQAGNNEFFDLTVRKIAKAAGLVKQVKGEAKENTAAVHRGLAVLTKIGMIEKRENEVKNRPATFLLVPLSKLAMLGTETLAARLGVSGGNTELEEDAVNSDEEQGAEAAQGGVDTLVMPPAAAHVPAEAATPPAASDESGVSGGNTEANVTQKPLVFQKQGVGVSESGGPCSKNPEPVFQKPDLLIKPKQTEHEVHPLPPEGDLGGGPVLPFEDCRPGDAGFAASAGIAARWVLHSLGVTKHRLEPAVVKQFELRLASNRDETLAVVAQLIVDRRREYLALQEAGALRFGPWELSNFLSMGHWQNKGGWPIKQEHALRSPSAGYSPSPPKSQEEQRAEWVLAQERRAFRLEDFASQLASAECPLGYIQRVALIAEQIRKCADYTDLQKIMDSLAAVQNELYKELFAAMPEDELVERRRLAAVACAAHLGKGNADADRAMKKHAMEVRLRKDLQIPDLNSFYQVDDATT